MSTNSPIQQFYAGQSVLITGGTGFLGKILIEKLLRSCPDIATIYILMRPKKGLNIYQRLDNLLENTIFQRLRDENPKFPHKVVAIEGDCILPGLGLSSSDRQTLLHETSIVFHAAATVRFNEKIQDAVAINIQGTKETLSLCRYMKKLTAIVHVSTAYSNCTKSKIDEQFYDSPISGDSIMELVQNTDNEKLKIMTNVLLNEYPNTYTYTKQIAEQVVLQYGKELPVGVFRPAIIISTYKEPIEGWTDNVYGPTGLIIGGGMGFIRTICFDKSCIAELVPVDYTVNALIATAWDIASNKNEAANPPIYNYISSWNQTFTWGDYIDLAFKYGLKTPSINSIWYYSITAVTNYTLYCILFIFLHIIPGMFIDFGMILTGRQAKMLKIYNKIHKLSAMTTYFGRRSWQFKFNTTESLWESLTEDDKKLFYFSLRNFDWEDFMGKLVLGLRTYIMKDDPSTIEEAKKRMAKFRFLHFSIKYAFICFIVCFTYCILFRFFA